MPYFRPVRSPGGRVIAVAAGECKGRPVAYLGATTMII